MSILEDELRKKLYSDYENYKNTKAKIALIGQPGAGKSSLINALVGEHLFEVGVHTDTTTKAQEVNFGPLVITDLPGYGTDKFPLDNWIAKFQPEQYDLYLFVFEGKLHDSDEKLFNYFKKWKRERNHPFFIVRTKADALWDPQRSVDELKKDITNDVTQKMNEPNTKIYFVSSRMGIGIDELKNAILESPINEVIKSKIITSFRASNLSDLDKKREECNKIIHKYALASAGNGFNPIPGTDILLDFKIIKEMLDEIKSAFGIADLNDVSKYEKYGPIATNLINRIIKYLGTDGIKEFLAFLIKKFGKKVLLQRGSKYLPFLGNIMSAALAAIMVEITGKDFADDCYNLAKIILEDTIKTTSN